MKRLLPWLQLTLLLTACSGVKSSVVSTAAPVAAYHGPVHVQATGAPSGRELGVVQVVGRRTIEELMPEFKLRVGELGGNVGLVDSIKSRFEMQTVSQVQTYSCGTTTAPMSCTRTQIVNVEVMTVQLLGRAFQQ